jgi:MFS family permease
MTSGSLTAERSAASAASDVGAIPAREAESGYWGIVLLVSFGVLIAYADRSSIASAIAHRSFVEHFHMSDVDRGWLGAAFFWSYALAQMPLGWTVDRYGVKIPYAICFTLWCLATATTGLMTVFTGVILVRSIVGAMEAVVMPASYRWLRDNVPERHSGAAIGIFAMGNKIGTAIGAPFAAWLIASYNWQLMFLVTGLLGLVWLAPWLRFVRHDLPKRNERAAARKHASAVPLRNIISSPVVWGGIIINFCYSYFIFYSMTWMPSYLVEQRGLALATSGLYTFFSFAGIAIVALAAGWTADRIIDHGGDPVRTRKIFVVLGFCGASTVLLGAYTTDLGMALFWNIFSLASLGLASANALALCKVTLIPKPAIGLVAGVQHMAAGLSGGLAASLSGWLLSVTGSYDLPMKVIVIFLAGGAAACVVLLRPEWSPKVEQPDPYPDLLDQAN